MNIKDIPEKDLRIIENVADHVVRRNTVPTYSDDDLRQELTIIGMTQYVERWDESKQAMKVEAKRDNNLRIYMRNLLNNRVKNLARAVNAQKNRPNVNVTTVDTQDQAFTSIFTDSESGPELEVDFAALGVDEDQAKILQYIAANGLAERKGQKEGATREEIGQDLGIPAEDVKNTLENMKNNEILKEALTNGL